MSQDLKETLNKYGSKKEPFFFVISYDLSKWDVTPLKNLSKDIKYSFEEIQEEVQVNKDSTYDAIELEEYREKFQTVLEHIQDGNTYLFNLTQPTNFYTPYSLDKIYNITRSRCKLYYKDQFVCFSPERFVEINNNKIFTYPMKGTIDADIPNAKKLIMDDPKELAEHTMVVDLLRNDLSIVSSNVQVDQFRYCDKIKAGKKELLQISSKISGELKSNWHDELGDIITSLLPAGSITGTPKKKTLELIQEIEQYDRKFFTGICGEFDGENLKSYVMIRFIEKNEYGELVYKSGGGITADSDLVKEYQEMCDKVYLP